MGRTTMNAKEAIIKSFGVILESKQYYKISVKEVVEHAGVTRQIFYYYFKNKGELLESYCNYEAEIFISQRKQYDSFGDAYRYFLTTLEEKRKIISNVNSTQSLGALNNILEYLAKSVCEKLLNEKLDFYEIEGKDREFIINYYKIILSSLSLQWVSEGMVENTEYMVNRLSKMIDTTLDTSLQLFSKKDK